MHKNREFVTQHIQTTGNVPQTEENDPLLDEGIKKWEE